MQAFGGNLKTAWRLSFSDEKRIVLQELVEDVAVVTSFRHLDLS